MRRALPLLTVAVVLVLAGCTEPATTTPSPTASTDQEPASPSASASADPAPPIDIKPATCENMLEPVTAERIATEGSSTGLQIIPGWADKMQDEGNLLGRFVEFGGVSCAVGFVPGDNISPYAWSPIDEESTVAVQVQLTSEQFEPRPDPLGELWCLPAELAANGAEPCYLFRDADWFFTDTASLMQGYVDRLDAL
ncbi:MAG: hypothetical protein RI885_909 [Actinomycetota bacterium]|jgi:hypothetical protein